MYSSTITQYEERPKKKEVEGTTSHVELTECDGAPMTYVWHSLFLVASVHVVAVYGLFWRVREISSTSWIFQTVWALCGGIGVTAGVHRLWAHRSYSAKLPLRILLGVFYLMAGQTHLFKWVRDHRTHHKFTETDADPHNSRRGFFFSHVGWLMVRRHAAVKVYGKKIDMSDVEADPVVYWVDKYFEFTMTMVCFVIPTLISMYCWDEKYGVAISITAIRYVFLLNATFCVNSVAHMFGNKPYNKNIKAVENKAVAFFALGEGWHNYHHVFPWDYKTAELPDYGFNLTTAFIDGMAWLGWAYDLKTPTRDIVERVSRNKGDGTVSKWGYDHRPKKLHH